MIDPRRVPPLLRHMIAAIFRRNKGKEEKRLLDAVACAKASLLHGGHITKASMGLPLDQVQLTSSGIRLDRQHRGKGRKDDAEFIALFAEHRAALEGDPEGEKG